MTLLELLVALAVLGLLLAALAAILHFTYGFSAAWLRRSEVQAEATPAYDLLEALIADARPQATGGAVLFDGAQDRLSFVAPLGGGFADAGGLQVIRLGREAGALRIAWSPLDDGAPVPGTAGAATLLPNVSALRFRYFGSDAPGAGPSWHDRWEGRAALPLLVDVALSQAGATAATDLIVAPRVTGLATSNQR